MTFNRPDLIIVVRRLCQSRSMMYFNQRESESHHYSKKKIKIDAAAAPGASATCVRAVSCWRIRFHLLIADTSHSRLNRSAYLRRLMEDICGTRAQHTTPAKLFQRLTMIRSRSSLFRADFSAFFFSRFIQR
jgi:hypothetical protein